jgi:predicted phage terminase large subunit-like protein
MRRAARPSTRKRSARRTISTRQVDAATTIRVGIMQRLHFEDTAAKCIEAGDYTVLCLPMEYDREHPLVWARDPRKEKGELLWPDRYPREEVDALRVRLGPTAAAAQLDQLPAPAGGAMFKRDHFAIRRKEREPAGARQIITVDCAFKKTAGSDRVAIQVWAKEWSPRRCRFHPLDARAERLGFFDTVQAVRDMRAKWPKVTAIHVEERANGNGVIEALSRDIPGVRPWPPAGEKFPGKEERANACLAYFENGEIVLPESAPWVEDFVDELCRFPLGANDDQVDAATMALLILSSDPTEKYRKAFGG